MNRRLWGFQFCVFLLLANLVLSASVPLYLSWNTPFALIDDLTDWFTLSWLSSLKGWKEFILGNFGFDKDYVRFRPMYEFQQLFSWGLAGTHSGWHHIIRWIEKGLGAFAGMGICAIFVNSISENSEEHLTTYWIRQTLVALTFLTLYFLFPNNPEARLAPVELHVASFFLIFFYFLCVAMTRGQGSLKHLTIVQYCGLLISFAALAWGKETSIAFVAPTCLYFFYICTKNFRPLTKDFFLFIPFFMVGVHLFAKVVFLSRIGGHGRGALNWESIKVNFDFILYFFNLLKPVLLLNFILVIILFFKKKVGSFAKSKYVQFVVFYFLFFCGILLTSWAPVLRYEYPLVPLFSLFSAFLVAAALTYIGCTNTLYGIITATLINQSGQQLHNFWGQSIAQYNARKIEANLLRDIGSYIDKNYQLVIQNIGEHQSKVEVYFEYFLPFFHQKKPHKAIPSINSNERRNYIYVSRGQMQTPSRYGGFKYGRSPFEWSKNISRFFNFGREPVYPGLDAGTDDFQYKQWDITPISIAPDDLRTVIATHSFLLPSLSYGFSPGWLNFQLKPPLIVGDSMQVLIDLEGPCPQLSRVNVALFTLLDKTDPQVYFPIREDIVVKDLENCSVGFSKISPIAVKIPEIQWLVYGKTETGEIKPIPKGEIKVTISRQDSRL